LIADCRLQIGEGIGHRAWGIEKKARRGQKTEDRGQRSEVGIWEFKMIDILKKFFGKSATEGTADKKEEAFHDIRIATCALLLEMANIDGEFSDAERESIIAILKGDYHLSTEHAAALIEAANEELERSIDLWQFTNLINQNYSRDEKLQIIETVWQVVYTDGKLDKYEDYLIHKLAKLLRLTHKELIDAKLKVIHSE
jgi:uncharacterized tellurite resistance protein B-like protein